MRVPEGQLRIGHESANQAPVDQAAESQNAPATLANARNKRTQPSRAGTEKRIQPNPGLRIAFPLNRCFFHALRAVRAGRASWKGTDPYAYGIYFD